MEQSNRNQGSTKMAVKIGAGGGIGAVFLLGGALATAALASAFVVGRNGRSSVKDHHRCHKSPPVDDPEYENPSNGATKELVESDNDTSAVDEKLRVEEVNTEDIEASEQSPRSIGLEKLETDAISDGSVEEKIHFLDEKFQLDPQDEDVDNEIPEEGQKPEQLREPTDEECDGTCRQKAVEGVAEKQPVKVDSGEVLLCCDHEEIKVILVDNSVDEEVPDDRKEAEENLNETEGGELDEEKRSDNGESHSKDGHENANDDEKEGRYFPSETVEIVQECEFIEEELLEDGQKIILPVSGSLDVEHEHTTGDEKEVKECEFVEEQSVEDGTKKRGVDQEDTNGDKEKAPLPVDTAEIILKDSELIEGGEEGNPVTNGENHLAKEQEKCGDADEFIVVGKHEDTVTETGDEIPFGISTVSSMLQQEAISVSVESIQVAENHEKDFEPEIEKEAKEEPISLENVKVRNEYNAMNEEVVDESTEAIAGIETTCDFPVTKIIEDGEKGENQTEDSVEETFVSDRVQLTYHQEVEGKILEDKAVEKVDKKEVNYSGKASIGKYVTDLAALNDRRMMIVTLSSVSSISCSWFFGLSFGRLCLVMFLTMVLSSMVVTA